MQTIIIIIFCVEIPSLKRSACLGSHLGTPCWDSAWGILVTAAKQYFPSLNPIFPPPPPPPSTRCSYPEAQIHQPQELMIVYFKATALLWTRCSSMIHYPFKAENITSAILLKSGLGEVSIISLVSHVIVHYAPNPNRQLTYSYCTLELY